MDHQWSCRFLFVMARGEINGRNQTPLTTDDACVGWTSAWARSAVRLGAGRGSASRTRRARGVGLGWRARRGGLTRQRAACAGLARLGGRALARAALGCAQASEQREERGAARERESGRENSGERE
jgi:hypothetical protein